MKVVHVAGLVSLVAGVEGATTIGLYSAVNDVSGHSKVDLDVIDMSVAMEDGDFELASSIYNDGTNSQKSDGTMRTLAGFSTKVRSSSDSIQTDKAPIQILPELNLFSAYYGSDTYGHEFVTHALEGTGFAEGLGEIPRIELAEKGAQYQNVFMYVLYEMAKALSLCYRGESSLKNWEEGVAFYTGSIINGDGSGDGALLYTLALKRSGAFFTTDDIGQANANIAAFEAFEIGAKALQEEDCEAASEQYQVIRKQMQIPLIQGIIQYAVKSFDEQTPKAMAEGWAFTAALLPFFDEIDSTLAAEIKEDMEYVSGVNQTVPNGPDRVIGNLLEIMPQLCIYCEEINVAGLLPTVECVDNLETLEAACEEYLKPAPAEEETVSVGVIVGLVVALLVVVALIVVAMRVLNSDDPAAAAAPPPPEPEATPVKVDIEKNEQDVQKNLTHQ